MPVKDDFWVFAYGSLMWQPGFPFEDKQMGRVRGYHRALCIYSHVYRGTPERPGLVLGLDRGGSCTGVVFKVAPEHADQTLTYLREREQVTMVYREVTLSAILGDGRRVQALAYVVDRSHTQYAGALALADLERFVRQGRGISGANAGYVISTYEHMAGLGIRDQKLAALTKIFGGESASSSASLP